MSRIGNKPIDIPSGVQCTLDGRVVRVKGPKGEMSQEVPQPITVRQEDNTIFVERPTDERTNRALHGLTRALIANHVHGVTAGFERRLEIIGVGYRAESKGQTLTMALGYSHPIVYDVPTGVIVKVEGNTNVILESCDKQLLGETAAKVRSFRPPRTLQGKRCAVRWRACSAESWKEKRLIARKWYRCGCFNPCTQ